MQTPGRSLAFRIKSRGSRPALTVRSGRPTGRTLCLCQRFYPDCEGDVCNQERDEKQGKSKVKAKIRLFYRHLERVHRIQAPPSLRYPAACDAPSARECVPRDLTPGDPRCHRSISAARTCMRSRRMDRDSLIQQHRREVEAASTNNEIFLVSIAGATPKEDFHQSRSDSTPLYSARWKKCLAWRSMARAGFESGGIATSLTRSPRGRSGSD